MRDRGGEVAIHECAEEAAVVAIHEAVEGVALRQPLELFVENAIEGVVEVGLVRVAPLQA